MVVRTNEHGMLLDLRCHDGHLTGVNIRDSEIDLIFRREDGSEVQVVLGGVRSFALNEFLEGNIVDSVYEWPIAVAPILVREAAAEKFSCEQEFFDKYGSLEGGHLFLLECSYGAKIYALIREVSIMDR